MRQQPSSLVKLGHFAVIGPKVLGQKAKGKTLTSTLTDILNICEQL